MGVNRQGRLASVVGPSNGFVVVRPFRLADNRSKATGISVSGVGVAGAIP